MSYTNQEVSWEPHDQQDSYGDIEHPECRTVKVRKQCKQEIVKTAEGRELLSRSYFYVDPHVEPAASDIGEMDRLDGELIVSKYAMCDIRNKVKMIRFITV